MAFVSIISWMILWTSTYVNADCELTCSIDEDKLQDVLVAMLDLGYDVDTGYFEVYDPETSNINIPFARSDTDYLISQFDDGRSYTRFGGQDAIVFRTCTPPNVKYFGYRSYSAARITKQNADNTPTEYTILEASLGDTLNHAVINTESSDITSFDPPFDRITNIVTTGDEQTWTDIVESFTNVDLLTEMSINLDAMNNGILSKLGLGWVKYSRSELDVPRDTISIVYRIQWDDDNSECNHEQYLNQSFPFYRFYKDSKKPRCAINRDLRKTKDYHQKCEHSSENKYYFEKAVGNIIEYMKKEHNYKFISNEPLNDDDGHCKWFGDWWPPNKDDFVYIFKHGFYCILYEKDCMFDNRDTYYSWDGTDHTLGDNDFYLIVGLNHNNYSLSTTNSISLSRVTNLDNGNAFEIIDTITNDEYQKYDIGNTIKLCNKHRRRLGRRGTSKSMFHSHEHAHIKDRHDCSELKNVFAVQVARPENCINEDIPSMCPDTDTLGAEDRFIFFGEATLNPKTKTMPDQDCLIEWRLLKFRKCDGNTN